MKRNNNYSALNEEFAKILPCDVATLLSVCMKLYPMKSEKDVKKILFGWMYQQDQKTIKSIHDECQKTWEKKIAMNQRISNEVVN